MFKNKGNQIGVIKNFSPKEVYEECCSGAWLLDLRRSNEINYKSFDVENLIIARPEEVKENFEDLPKEKPLIVADNAGIRSKQIIEFLQEKGFTNLANLSGGMFEWDKDNLPLRINNREQLNGSCLCALRPNKTRK
ncbi:MAG: rhodanese-like domain-containing protein [Rhodothermaceae bacterium]